MSTRKSAASLEQPENERVEFDEKATIINSFRLGWLTSEVLGLVHHGALRLAPQQQEPDTLEGRLTISDGISEKKLTRRLRLSFSILLRLAEFLDVFDSEETSKPLKQLANSLDSFLDSPRQESVPAVSNVRHLLEKWSMDVWGKLSGDSPEAARAFTYGASIADTYWFIRDPSLPGAPESDKETWHSLLKHARLQEQAERVDELASCLPPFLSDALTHSLNKWGIEPVLRRQHSEQRGNKYVLNPEVEKLVYKNLQAQTRIWRQLILGEKLPINFVTPQERTQGRVWQVLGFSFLLVPIFSAVFLLVWLLVFLATTFVPVILVPLQAWVAASPTSGNDRELELIKLAVANLSILAVLGGSLWAFGQWAVSQLFRLYKWLGQKITSYYIVKHTTIPWNQGLKQ